MTEMDKLIELARDPEAFWHTVHAPEAIDQAASAYYLVISPAKNDDERVARLLEFLRERSRRRR